MNRAALPILAVIAAAVAVARVGAPARRASPSA